MQLLSFIFYSLHCCLQYYLSCEVLGTVHARVTKFVLGFFCFQEQLQVVIWHTTEVEIYIELTGEFYL